MIPDIWLGVIGDHPVHLQIFVGIRGHEAIPLRPDQARALVFLTNSYIDAVSGGHDHGGIGVNGILLDLTVDEAHLLADRLELLASIVDPPTPAGRRPRAQPEPAPGGPLLEQLATPVADILSPDCAVGKHQACSGDAWNIPLDTPAPCDCACHDRERR